MIPARDAIRRDRRMLAGLFFATIAGMWLASLAQADDEGYLGNLSVNPFEPSSSSNEFGYGSAFEADSINNPFGEYGSPFSNKSATNPFATDAPKLYDSEGNYRGRLSANPFDPESTSNPVGQYGSRVSPDSINNPLGAGNRFDDESPNNPFGQGLGIYDGQSDGPAGDAENDGEDQE